MLGVYRWGARLRVRPQSAAARALHRSGQLAGVLLVALVVGLALGWRWFETNRARFGERSQLVWQRVLTRPELQQLKARYPRAWTFLAARFARGEHLELHLTIGLVISVAGLWLL